MTTDCRNGGVGALRPCPPPAGLGGDLPSGPELRIPVWISPKVSSPEGPPRAQHPTQHHSVSH